MTLRVVLAVVLALALVAAAAPTVEDASGAAARRRGDAAANRAADGLRSLVERNDPVAVGAGGARRRLTLDLDAPAPFGPSVDYVAVGGVPNRTLRGDGPRSDVVAYRVRGRPVRVVRGLNADVRVVANGAIRADDRPLVLRSDAVVTARLVRYRGVPTVLVTRGAASESLYPEAGPAGVCETC